MKTYNPTHLLVTGLLATLLLGVMVVTPASAQKRLSLDVEDAMTSDQPVNRDGFRQRLIANLACTYQGDEAIPVKVVMGLYDQRGDVVADYQSRPFTVRPGANCLPADKVPPTQWFPAGIDGGGARAMSLSDVWDALAFWRRIAPVAPEPEEPEEEEEPEDQPVPRHPRNILGQIHQNAQSRQAGGNGSDLMLGVTVVPAEEVESDHEEEEVHFKMVFVGINTGGGSR